MTSFWGYVTEGIVLLVLAFWWLINTCADIIMCQHKKRTNRWKMTSLRPRLCTPVEILYKFVISACGLIGQLAYAGGKFHDDTGNFSNMTQLMYMSVYAIFVLHSVLDLALWLRLPLVKGSNYASAATGFFWYALALHSRTEDFHHEGVWLMVRVLPVYILFVISACFVLESLSDNGSLGPVVRAFCLLTHATWCFQSARMLHAQSPFPAGVVDAAGSSPNPSWNPTDHGNIAYTAAIFGLHLCVNLVLTASAYSATALFLRMRRGIVADNEDDIISGYGYKSLRSTFVDDDVAAAVEEDSKVVLLSASET